MHVGLDNEDRNSYRIGCRLKFDNEYKMVFYMNWVKWYTIMCAKHMMQQALSFKCFTLHIILINM